VKTSRSPTSRRSNAGKDDGIDFIISRPKSDQSSPTEVDTWVVQVKAYRERRVNLAVVRQLLEALERAPPETKGMLVTNGHLTSVTREFLSEALTEAGREFSHFNSMLLMCKGQFC
jgi:Restriction endonuclease